MGHRLGEQDGYPVGVSGSDSHFYDNQVECHLCGATVIAAEECSECEATLDAELGYDRAEPDEDHYPERCGR